MKGELDIVDHMIRISVSSISIGILVSSILFSIYLQYWLVTVACICTLPIASHYMYTQGIYLLEKVR